jgi:nitrous oxidase accessory protein NosD
MSYTLRGRLESRLATALVPFLVACGLALALQEWWPIQLAALMLAVGLALDATTYHRLLPYQPGWAALPLGALELGLVLGLALGLDVAAPLWAGLLFFAGAWLVAQTLTHAAFPVLHLSYAEDGGELGRGGTLLDAAAPATLLLVVGIAWVTQPPTVRLEAGVHQGPLVLDHAQRLVGEPGAVVRGGIRITADDVVVRDVAVFGGEYGIEVLHAEDVVLDRVTVAAAVLDGINVRRSSVTIRDCAVTSLQSPYSQGIDISFGFDLAPSTVERCTVSGAREGIVTHFTRINLEDNRVSGTSLRAIAVTEMSMGHVEGNQVDSARGVGIFCGDYSQCRIVRNSVANTRPDPESDEGTRQGYAIQAHFGATATLEDNTVVASPYGVGAFFGARIERE